MADMTLISPVTDYDTAAPPDWGVADLDLDAYLAYLGVPAGEPSVSLLTRLHIAHVRTIPFDNVDVLLGKPSRLDLGSLTDKLVGRGRGGYCFEHAPLFAAAVQRLGFPVRRRLARVHPQGTGARTHALSIVTVDGADHVVDVGFGASVWRPMPLVDGAEVDQAGWPMRLHAVEPGRWLLLRAENGGWVTDHEFTDEPVRPVDYEMGHHYTATHRDSPFLSKLVVRRLAEGISTRLVGDELTVLHADGRSSTERVGPDRLPGLLAELDLGLDDAEVRQLVDTYREMPGEAE